MTVGFFQVDSGEKDIGKEMDEVVCILVSTFVKKGESLLGLLEGEE